MKALTVYQPWASLIAIGAKPYEFRRWDFAARFPSLVGQRIVIHASTRAIRLCDVTDILIRIHEGESALKVEIARPALERLADALAAGKQPPVPLGCGVGTATLGQPVKSFDLFKDHVADSSRIDQHLWAWPMLDP